MSYWNEAEIEPTTKPCVKSLEEFRNVLDFFKGGSFRIGTGRIVWQLVSGQFYHHAGWNPETKKTYPAGVVFLQRRNEKGEVVRTTTHLNRLRFAAGEDAMAR